MADDEERKMPEFFLQALRGAAGLLRGFRERSAKPEPIEAFQQAMNAEQNAKLRVLWGEPSSEDHT